MDDLNNEHIENIDEEIIENIFDEPVAMPTDEIEIIEDIIPSEDDIEMIDDEPIIKYPAEEKLDKIEDTSIFEINSLYYKDNNRNDDTKIPSSQKVFEAKKVSIPKINNLRKKRERRKILIVSITIFALATFFSFQTFNFFSQEKNTVISSVTTEKIESLEKVESKVYNYNVVAKEWDDHQYKFTINHYYEKYNLNYTIENFDKLKISRDTSKDIYWDIYIDNKLKFQDVHYMEIEVIKGYLFLYLTFANDVGNNLIVYDKDGVEFYNLKQAVDSYEDIDLNVNGIRVWANNFKLDTLTFKVYSNVGAKMTTCDNIDNMIVYLEFEINFVDDSFTDFKYLNTVKTRELCGKEEDNIDSEIGNIIKEEKLR